ncbi:hypothetical protein [Zavarzinia sp. CC-PAN008]|uniref:hypothetical protein n=1 Tax=Zavarzinia sp. CC-PAN008 TaxID=3243332 RepID=UPI003F743A2B
MRDTPSDASLGNFRLVLAEIGPLLERCRLARMDLGHVLDRLAWLDEPAERSPAPGRQPRH